MKNENVIEFIDFCNIILRNKNEHDEKVNSHYFETITIFNYIHI